MKRFLMFFLVVLSLFGISASGANELGYVQIGSLSDDPFVSMKALTYIDIYEEVLWDRLELAYEEINDTVLLKFSAEIDAYNAMEPAIWETDDLFDERVEQVEEELFDAMYNEVERIVIELLVSVEEKTELLDGYAGKAMDNLARSRTLAGSSLTVQSTSYDRNARIWSLSLSGSDKQVSFAGIPLALDFTTIGDEGIIRDEIIAFEQAIKDARLEASVRWHFFRDHGSESRFLLVMDYLSITNPLTESSYAVNLEKPILIRTYTVTGQTVETLSVQESSYVSRLGVANLVYSNDTGQLFALSEPKDSVSLAWGVEKQAVGPKSIQRPESATSAVTQAPEASQEESAKAHLEEEKGPMMPNLPLTRLDGTETSFHDVRDGKPAVINYFASWCPPCKQELPHFQKAFDEYGDRVSFIFLDVLDGQRETLATINAFIKSFPFSGPVFYDQGEFAMTFQTNSLPTTVFLDKEGRVVKGYLGFVAEDVLYADIADLLD